jgi:hypothetical protein
MSTTVTVKEVMQSRFDHFVTNLKPILPELAHIYESADIELLELMELFLFLFPNDNYGYHLDQLCEMKNYILTEEQKSQILPHIQTYVSFLRKINNLLQ